MKTDWQEYFKEHRKELIALIAIATLIAGGTFLALAVFEGGDGYVPEEFTEIRGKVEQSLNRALGHTEDALTRLAEILELESSGNTTRLYVQLDENVEELEALTGALVSTPGNIEKLLGLMGDVRPRAAQARVTEGLTVAALMVQEYVELRDSIRAIQDGIRARVEDGTPRGEFSLNPIQVKISRIEALRGEYIRLMSEFDTLTASDDE